MHACQRVHPAGRQVQDRREQTQGRCQSKVLAGHTCGKLAKPQLEEEVRLRSWTRGCKTPSPFSSVSPVPLHFLLGPDKPAPPEFCH